LRTPDGKTHSATSSGNGPVDATYRAIDAVINMPASVQDFSIHAATKGRSGLGNVWVRVANQQSNRSYGGFGSDSDIIVASAKAYLAALNNALADYENKELMGGSMEDVGVMMVG
jgi:2-isopropylmalate synthase